MQEDELVAAVLGPCGFVMTGIRRLVLAIALRENALSINTLLAQGGAGGESAMITQGAVIFFRTAFVAVAFDHQFGAGIGFQGIGNALNIGFFGAQNGGAIKLEMNGVTGPSRAVGLHAVDEVNIR